MPKKKNGTDPAKKTEKKASKKGQPALVADTEPEQPPSKAAKAAKPRKASSPKPKTARVKSTIAKPTIEEISLRAYYIGERRQRMGWPGDSQSDWLEAERQLLAEAAEKA